MNQYTIFIIKLFVTLITAGVMSFLFRKRTARFGVLLIVAGVFWIGMFSGYLACTFPDIKEEITITALGSHHEQGQWNQIILLGYEANGEENGFFYSLDGAWPREPKGETDNEDYWYWVAEGEKWQEWITPDIKLHIPVGVNRVLLFGGGPYNGQAQVGYAGEIMFLDTFSPDEGVVRLTLPDSGQALQIQNELEHMPAFLTIFFVLVLSLYIVVQYLTAATRFRRLKEYRFLFMELIKRDFTLKYKRTVLGMLWSVLSPLFNLLIMWLVFNNLLGQGMAHYSIYLFIGQLIFSYFSDATMQGMTSLLDNAGIFTKVNVPKYMFLLSKNVSSLINFGLTMILLGFFVGIEGITFHWRLVTLVFPIACIIVFNVGIGLILSALFVFFRDIQYLWGIFTQLLMWMSATFYSITTFPYKVQCLFLVNPLYLFNRYFRKIIIEGAMPSLWFHLLMIFYAMTALAAGCFMYKKYNHEFLYYV